MNRFLIITCMQRFMTSCTLQTNPHITRYVHYKMKIIKLWFVYTKWFYAYRMQTYTIMTVT